MMDSRSPFTVMHAFMCRWHRRSLSAAIVVLLSIAPRALAQEGGRPAVRVSGGLTLTGDVYDFRSTPDSAEQPRRPSSLFRLIFNPTIHIGDLITLPFNIMVSSRETNVVTPNAKNSSFLQFLQNPMNNLGFLSFSPRIGWAEFQLGTHVPSFSELSTGDEQVFGAGFDLKPGRFRIAASAGSTQRAIESDSAASVRGAYARHQMAMKLGYGSEATFVHVNVVRAKDDPASLRRVPAGVLPMEGMVASMNFRVAVTELLSVTGEAAGSAMTRDMRADDFGGDSPVPASLFRTRVSSRTDAAGTLAVALDDDAWGVRLSGRYIGAGYASLAWPFLQSDRAEAQIAPRVRLFGSGLRLNGSIGMRVNNLSKTNGTTTTQVIGSANALATLSDALSLSVRYANFGIRNTLTNDTLKLETVTNSLSIAPTWTLQNDAAMHTVTVSWALDAFTDYNTVSGAQGSNNTQTVMLVYAASFVETPLGLTASGLRMTNDLPASTLVLYSASAGATYRLFEGAVVPGLQLSWSSNALSDFTPDVNTLLRLSVQWNLTSDIALSAALSRNDYRYGSSRPGTSFVETFLESSIAWRF